MLLLLFNLLMTFFKFFNCFSFAGFDANSFACMLKYKY